jgi:hypothetical protein
MPEPKTHCTTCGRSILQRTADRNGGLCAVCLQDAKSTRDQREYEIVPPDPVTLNVHVDVSTLQDSHGIVWKNVEDALLLITSKYVQAFGAVHRDKNWMSIHGAALSQSGTAETGHDLLGTK